MDLTFIWSNEAGGEGEVLKMDIIAGRSVIGGNDLSING